jgi:hypothetical protein
VSVKIIHGDDDGDFEPDAVLHCGEPLSGDASAVPKPMVVAEALSPGTRTVDLSPEQREF